MHPPPPEGTTGNAPPAVVGTLGCGSFDGCALETPPNPTDRANATALKPNPNVTRWPCISVLPRCIQVSFDSEPNANRTA
jgi:hypothetical protein